MANRIRLIDRFPSDSYIGEIEALGHTYVWCWLIGSFIEKETAAAFPKPTAKAAPTMALHGAGEGRSDINS